MSAQQNTVNDQIEVVYYDGGADITTANTYDEVVVQ